MGTYCLLIHLKDDSKIKIGKLGEIDFKKGYYVYVGSALNSLESRIKRHLSSAKKIFWHIDYLLASKNSKIMDVIFTQNHKKWECNIAGEISGNGDLIKGFGCSDCKCNSHLFYFKSFKDSKDTCIKSFRNFKLETKELDDLNLEK